MARVGGRSLWLAWPIGVLCAGVVGVLVWLAAPGIPGAIDFVGSTLRGATSAPAADADSGASGTATPAAARDCRDVYPDRLWAELTWTPDVLLSQNAAPAPAATSLVAALAPDVRISCTWRVGAERSVSTTIATVALDAAPIALATLTAEGYACSEDGDVLHCERTHDGVVEVHDVRGDVWITSILTRWAPPGYAADVAAHAFAALAPGA